jgi:hypothetical protein
LEVIITEAGRPFNDHNIERLVNAVVHWLFLPLNGRWRIRCKVNASPPPPGRIDGDGREDAGQLNRHVWRICLGGLPLE